MSRRPDERFAVTVSMTTAERDLLLRLVDREDVGSMPDLLRLLIQRGLVDEGMACPPPLFERATKRKRDDFDEEQAS